MSGPTLDAMWDETYRLEREAKQLADQAARSRKDAEAAELAEHGRHKGRHAAVLMIRDNVEDRSLALARLSAAVASVGAEVVQVGRRHGGYHPGYSRDYGYSNYGYDNSRVVVIAADEAPTLDAARTVAHEWTEEEALV